MLKSLFSWKKNHPQPTSEIEPQPIPPFDEARFIHETFGFDAEVVSATPLSKGLSNLSLTEFTSPRGAFMIRKSISKHNDSEAAFMLGLCNGSRDLNKLFHLKWTMPKVYAVNERETAVDIYMEIIDGIAFRNKADAAPLARPLAKAIHDLSVILPAVCLHAELSLKERGIPGKEFYAKAAVYLRGDVEKLRDIARLQRSVPRQVCHNDIFWPNMGITEHDEGNEIKFIDFGMLGLNSPGAELHHFARISGKSKQEADFFRRLSRHYAALTRLDQRLIEMNALFYAAMRLMAFEKEKAIKSCSKDVQDLLIRATDRFDAINSG